MEKYIAIFLGVLVLSTVGLKAQSSEDKFIPTKQFGVVFSTLGGSGLYYLHPLTERDNLKATGIFIYDQGDEYKDSYFSLGAEYQRDIWEADTRRFYAGVGTSIDNDVSSSSFFEDAEYTDTFLNLGGGFGFDLGNRVRGMVFNLHVTYQLTKGFGSSDQTRVGLGGGLGFGFNF